MLPASIHRQIAAHEVRPGHLIQHERRWLTVEKLTIESDGITAWCLPAGATEGRKTSVPLGDVAKIHPQPDVVPAILEQLGQDLVVGEVQPVTRGAGVSFHVGGDDGWVITLGDVEGRAPQRKPTTKDDD